MVKDNKPRKIRLSANPTAEALADLRIGDIVYLDGTVYTAREGVYKRVLEDGIAMPMDLPADSAANFHCSPAATQHDDGSFDLGAVTATASFRFSKWIGPWLAASGAKLIIGKGGMSSKDYREHFVPHGAIYLTTVGYGTGALLGVVSNRLAIFIGKKNLDWPKPCGFLMLKISAHSLSKVTLMATACSNGKMPASRPRLTRSMREQGQRF
jgi:tartrate dehydratase beta subunit/fumarate hydratase class I family protein